MKDGPEGDLNQRIAERVRDLRTARGLTLETLAERSGVSRSMISLIERGESSPTAVLLERLAAGLGVHQQVWILEGAIDVSVGDACHQLGTGDCLAFVLDRPTSFHNRTRKAA